MQRHRFGRLTVLSGLGIAAIAMLCATSARRPYAPQEARASGEAATPPATVLVELFTSEGCSSCPPAEEELSRLEAEQPVAGARIVAVGFHVDYWNDLGWADPFSSIAWSDRQRAYDGSRDGRVYTPQAIVQGARDCVGSDDGALRSLVRQAAATPGARVSVAMSPVASEAARLRVAINVAGLPPSTAGDAAEVRAILVERGLVVDVPRGENSGRRLRHAPVARDLASAGVITGSAGSFDATFAVPPGSRRDALEAVAIVQEPGTRRVLGVGTSTPAAP